MRNLYESILSTNVEDADKMLILKEFEKRLRGVDSVMNDHPYDLEIDGNKMVILTTDRSIRKDEQDIFLDHKALDNTLFRKINTLYCPEKRLFVTDAINSMCSFKTIVAKFIGCSGAYVQGVTLQAERIVFENLRQADCVVDCKTLILNAGHTDKLPKTTISKVKGKVGILVLRNNGGGFPNLGFIEFKDMKTGEWVGSLNAPAEWASQNEIPFRLTKNINIKSLLNIKLDPENIYIRIARHWTVKFTKDPTKWSLNVPKWEYPKTKDGYFVNVTWRD